MAEEKRRNNMFDDYKNPLIEMNKQINKSEDRGSARGSYRMSADEKDRMRRVIETAQSFTPYTKKKGP